ncbi:hypothetical protein C9374_009766 [Naegleria lovaniensis]|uniref:Myosin motor domain-containing protein n=1 Tax=Naegleria lovaniensis TaxID=51637 RepID=A0AA88KS10_NAELO|nr:uncharacterized protein C9374_009766 [Naegleria lovaniensis]KAG2393189.1 hypothetical protein C9374_009766 [Naegleria lovaniensis]
MSSTPPSSSASNNTNLPTPSPTTTTRKKILQKTQTLDDDDLVSRETNSLRERSKAHPIFKTASSSQSTTIGSNTTLTKSSVSSSSKQNLFSQLITEQEFSKNHVWVEKSQIPPNKLSKSSFAKSKDGDSLYVIGKLLERNGNLVNVEILPNQIPQGLKNTSSGSSSSSSLVIQLPVMDVMFMNPPSMNKLQDLTQLTNVSEPCLIYYLKSRLGEERRNSNHKDQNRGNDGLIFTDCGGVAMLSTLSWNHHSSSHHGVTRREHDENSSSTKFKSAYLLNHLVTTQQNQSIVVLGDSASGKSTTLVQMLEDFAELTNSKMMSRVLDVIRVLEAFTNSSTEQSKCSSRVTRNIHLQLLNNDKEGHSFPIKVCGAYVECVNLQVTRSLVRVMEKLVDSSSTYVEKMNPDQFIHNFHVFYQLMADATLKEKYKLTQLLDKDHHQAGKLTFSIIQNSMKNIGFTEKEIGDVTKILCALLHLLNCDFIENENRKDENDRLAILSDSSKSSFNRTIKLLGVDELELFNTIVKPKVSVNSNLMETFADAVQANHNKDLIIMTLYEGLVQWIVSRMNEILKSPENKEEPLLEISLFDIGVGFESLATGVDAARGVKFNSLEQLVQNYSNEKLRDLVNEQLFKNAQDVYQKEEIGWKWMEFSATCSVPSKLVKFLEDEKDGVFSVIKNQALSMFRGSDEGMIISELSKLSLADQQQQHQQQQQSNQTSDNNNASKQEAQLFKPNLADMEMSLTHFNGKVTYKVTNWFQKALLPSDSMSTHTKEFLSKSSKNSIVQSIYTTLLTSQHHDTKSTGVQFVMDVHRENLEKQLEQLKHTEMHVIYCLRTSASSLNEKLILKQLRNYSINDMIRLARKSFASKIPYSQFVKRFCAPSGMSGDLKQAAKKLLEEHKWSENTDFKLGKTMVFLKPAHESLLYSHFSNLRQ